MEKFKEVNGSTAESVFKWQLKDFFSLSAEVDSTYRSPPFSYADASWYLEIYPNGQTKVPLMDGREENTTGHVGVTLFYESSGPPISLKFSLGIKTLDEEIDPEYEFTSIFESTKGHGAAFLISRSKLLERKSEFISSNVLTIVCKLSHPKYMEECPYYKINLGYQKITAREKMCMDTPFECSKCYKYDCYSSLAEAFDQIEDDRLNIDTDFFKYYKDKSISKGSITSPYYSYTNFTCPNFKKEKTGIIRTFKEESMDTPNKCLHCLDVVPVKTLLNSPERQQKTSEDLEKSMSDFNDNIELSEYLIQWKLMDEKFGFGDIFKTDMKEKTNTQGNKNKLTIKDHES